MSHNDPTFGHEAANRDPVYLNPSAAELPRIAGAIGAGKTDLYGDQDTEGPNP